MLNDEAQKIILNTKGSMEDLSKELLEFLAYVADSTDDTVNYFEGNLVKNIHKRVQEVKNDILVEVEFMTLLERDRQKIEEGGEEAIKQLILKQYSKGLSIDYIAEINEYVKDIVKNNAQLVNIKIKKPC